MHTFLILSCRDANGTEIDRLGPFEHVVMRPGSNWIEARKEGTWSTFSGAHYTRILIETIPTDDPPTPQESQDWNAPW